jgi:hypothetical protein
MLETVFAAILEKVSWNRHPVINERYVHTLKLTAQNFPKGSTVLKDAVYTLREFPSAPTPVEGKVIEEKMISDLSEECTDTLFWLVAGKRNERDIEFGEIGTGRWTVHQTQWLGETNELIFRARPLFVT